MEDFVFWKEWPKKEKYFYYLTFFIFILSTIWLVFSLFVNNSIGWTVVSIIERLPVAVQTVAKGLLEFPVEADIMYVTQQFKIADYKVNVNASLIFMILIAFAFNVLITATSFFRTWWYFGVLGMFILALAYFKFDLLMVYGDTRNIFLIAIILSFIGLNLIFNIIYSHIDFLTRFFAFSILTIVTTVIILNGAFVKEPLLYIANYGFYVPLALSIVFIILIAFDIIYFFLYLITSTKSATGKSNSLNFVVISLLYLGNLALMYCKKTGIVNWELLYIDEFILLFISIIVGIWTYRMRLEATSTIMDFAPFGAIFYLGMAIVTIASIAFSVSTNNDQLVNTLRDAILYSHLAIGSIFLIYVIFNFSTYMNRNLKVYEVVLKINRFPVHLVRVGGLVLATGLLVKGNFKQIYKTEAGYAAGIADIYMDENNPMLAEEFLNEAIFHDPLTQKANLASAYLKEINGRYEDAIDNYKKIMLIDQKEQLYAAMAYNYTKAGLPYSAMETLHEGISKYPKSSRLFNNLGVVFTKTHILDSTFHFLQRADILGGEKEVSRTNMLSFLIKKGLLTELPSYFEENSNYLPLETNKIAFRLLRKEAYVNPFKSPQKNDSIANLEMFAYHYNFGMSSLKTTDTIFDSFTNVYLKNDTIPLFNNELGLLKAYKKYYSGNRREALKEIFDLQKEDPSHAGMYFNTLGTWSMENNAPQLAIDFFDQAIENRNIISSVNQAIALLESGQKAEAIAILNQLVSSPDESIRTLSNTLLSNTTLKVGATDEDRLNYLALNKASVATPEFEMVYDGINDLNLRKRASVYLLEHYILTKNLIKARYMSLAKDLRTIDQNKVNLLKLELARLLADYKSLLPMADTMTLNLEDESQRLFYKALASEYTGGKQQAQKLYTLAIIKLPLNQRVAVDYANFQRKYQSIEAAYNTLLDAILLNPYGIDIQKAYCLMALESNLESYAEETLEKIKSLTTVKDYEQFSITYRATKSKMDSSLKW